MKVVLIDDEPLARSLVTAYLKSYPVFEVIAECNSGLEVVEAVQQYHRDLIGV